MDVSKEKIISRDLMEISLGIEGVLPDWLTGGRRKLEVLVGNRAFCGSGLVYPKIMDFDLSSRQSQIALLAASRPNHFSDCILALEVFGLGVDLDRQLVA
jgi:hypothetical protein